VDTANRENVETVRKNVAKFNPNAQVIETACKVTVPDPELVRGKRVLVVEDGPTLTHGEMPYGAGVVAAKNYGAVTMVDPRPFAMGSIKKTFEKFPHLGRVLPAMGYSDQQRHELEQTIANTPCDLVLIATPIDLAKAIKIEKPAMRVGYEVEEVGGRALTDLIDKFTTDHKPAPVGAGR
jgi:predicted GTPase